MQMRSLDLENFELRGFKEEVDRLNNLLNLKIGELDESRNKCGQLESQLGALASFEVTIQEFETKIHHLSSEIDVWKQRYQLLEQDRNQSIADMQAMHEKQLKSHEDRHKRNFERDRVNYNAEIKRLSELCDRLRKENESLYVRIHESEIQIRETTIVIGEGDDRVK